MEYELVIEKSKSKSLVAFLKQLDFVKITPVNKKALPARKTLLSPQKSISYFNAASGWDVDADILRKQSVRKNSKW